MLPRSAHRSSALMHAFGGLFDHISRHCVAVVCLHCNIACDEIITCLDGGVGPLCAGSGDYSVRRGWGGGHLCVALRRRCRLRPHQPTGRCRWFPAKYDARPDSVSCVSAPKKRSFPLQLSGRISTPVELGPGFRCRSRRALDVPWAGVAPSIATRAADVTLNCGTLSAERASEEHSAAATECYAATRNAATETAIAKARVFMLTPSQLI
jgi:hypothetical protein